MLSDKEIAKIIDSLPIVDEMLNDGKDIGVLSRNSYDESVYDNGYFDLEGDPFELGDLEDYIFETEDYLYEIDLEYFHDKSTYGSKRKK